MKRIVVMIVCASIVLVCGAVKVISMIGCKCGGSDRSNYIALDMYHYRDLHGSDAGNWDIQMERFAELHRDIKFRNIEFGYNDPYVRKLNAMALGGTLPDVFYLWPGKLTDSVTSRGLAIDLRPYLKGHESEFKAITFAPQGPNGEIYELAEEVTSIHIMFANKILMDRLGLTFPKTYAGLLEQGEKIRQAGLIPIAFANKDGWQMQACLLSTLVERRAGAHWYYKALKGNGASFTDQEFIDCLQIILELYDNNMFSPGVNQAEYPQAMRDYVNQKAVYYIDGAWKIEDLIPLLTEEQKKNTLYLAFPDIPNQKGKSGSTTAVQSPGFGIKAGLPPEKEKAAWDWVWFYAGPEGSKLNAQFGKTTAYNTKPPSDADVMIHKLTDFLTDRPMGPVMDTDLDEESFERLQSDLQEMMLGALTPADVAKRFEEWVRENDSNRK